MQDLQLLLKRGASPEALKKKLTAERSKLDPKVKKLMELHEQRLIRYVSRGFEDSKIYWTLDKIIDSSLRNMKFVQAREILATYPAWETEKLGSLFMNWGLGSMLVPVKTADGRIVTGQDSRPLLELDIPIFDTIFVPLVMAYRTMRWAKLFNARNTYPLYKYSPSHATTKHLSQCQIITEVIARQSVDMGHAATLKQSILQMLDYGFALRMPTCAWHKEEYEITEKGKAVTKVQREGVNWVVPRPERTFIDGVSPLSSLNTDTGTKFFGYWDLRRFGELKSDPKLWNVDKINYGSSQAFFKSSGWSTYQELYPCQLKIPTCIRDVDYATIDRQDKEFWYSASAEEDSATIITVMFDKIIPSEWNLFDYDFPVWTRWLYADTATPLYMEVLPYTPGAAYLYDYDANRGFQNSLTMQLSPFQQMFGNYLTQYYISVKNNLPRIAFYNTDIVDKDHIEQIRKEKEKLYQRLTLLPFSKREQSFSQQTQQDAFFPLAFPPANTSEIAGSLRLTIELLERMLGFPSQEVGQPASHEQTAREIIIVSGHSESRVDFTGNGVDEAEKSVKRANYEAWVQYGTDDITATIDNLSVDAQKALKEMGFEVEKGESTKQNTYAVSGPKSALLLSDFATDQTGTTRAEEPKVAIAMMQALGVALQNPMIFQAVGVEQMVDLINAVFVWGGLPEDFRLRVSEDYKTPEEQQKQFIEMLEKAKGEIIKTVMGEVQKALGGVADGIKKEVVDPTKQAFDQIGQQNQQRDQIIQQIMQALGAGGNGGPPQVQPRGPVPAPVPPGMPPGMPSQMVPPGAQPSPEEVAALMAQQGMGELPALPPGR